MNAAGEPRRVLQREALYCDVWSRPCTQIAAELGISSSALKRICSAMNIPTPEPGHWTRVQCGKTVKKAALPQSKPDTKMQWDVHLENSRSQKRRPVGVPVPKDDLGSEAPAPVYPVIELASNLEQLHPLVRATRAKERESRSRIPWDQRKERKRFNLNVSAGALDRALIFLDALARGVEAQGFTFRSAMDEQPERRNDHTAHHQQGRPSGVCWVQAGEERIAFSLKERNRRVKVEGEKAKTLWRDWSNEPSGVFEFSLAAPWGFQHTTTWKDGSRQKLESRLGEIVATLSPLAKYQLDERVRREREEEQRKRISDLRWRMDHQRSREKEVVEKLLQCAESNHRAVLLRLYTAALRAKLIEQHGSVLEDSPEDRLLQWMETRADMMDPLAGDPKVQVNRLVSQIPGIQTCLTVDGCDTLHVWGGD